MYSGGKELCGPARLAFVKQVEEIVDYHYLPPCAKFSIVEEKAGQEGFEATVVSATYTAYTTYIDAEGKLFQSIQCGPYTTFGSIFEKSPDRSGDITIDELSCQSFSRVFQNTILDPDKVKRAIAFIRSQQKKLQKEQ